MTNPESSTQQPTVDAKDVAANVKSSIRNRRKDRDDADSELISWWANEAAQAHKFRNFAFWGGFIASVLLFLIWIWVMLFYWPERWHTPTMTILLGVKFSLCTLTFLSVSIATLRFAIRCYGHHQGGNTANPNGIDSPDMGVVGKVLEAIGKAFNPQQ